MNKKLLLSLSLLGISASVLAKPAPSIILMPAGSESDVMVNGIDFYPTILSMSGIAKPDAKNLDGADLLPLLTGVADDHALVLDQHGKPRTEMVWHYPHAANPKLQSTLLSASALGSKNPSHQSPQPLAKHH